jgi:hypothetical protein
VKKLNVASGIVLMLIAVIVLHDGSMAVAGHAPTSASDHHGDHAQHDRTTVPENCGTVRLVTQRLSAPEPPVSDTPSSLVLVPDLPIFAAISESFLVVPVVPPPSACLARFQVFRI